jgi:uncharacterized protein (TIGR00730 family)
MARELGAGLARAGFGLVTGGYGGVMEAASRGAREEQGSTVGVVSDAFPRRRPNRYLSRTISTPDLYRRQQELIERARGYVVMQGRAGTLSELALVWALQRAGCLGRRPVVLLGGYWQDLLRLLTEKQSLEPALLARTVLAATPAETVRCLRERLGPDEGGTIVDR